MALFSSESDESPVRPWLVLLLVALAGAVVWTYAGRRSREVIPKDLPLYPVEGHVTVDGRPLHKGEILFVPDRTQGTVHMNYPYAKIEPDGTYRMQTWDKAGAPLGTYKVVVTATEKPMPANPAGWIPDWLLAEKYTQPGTTDLTFEVVALPEPGRYDLNLER